MKEKEEIEEVIDNLLKERSKEKENKTRKRRKIKIKEGYEGVVLIILHISALFLIILSVAWIFCYTPPSEDISPPKIIGEINHIELHHLIVNKTIWYGLSKNLFISDYKYKLTSVSEIKRFLSQDNTDRYIYEDNYYDCDDFAVRLYGKIKTQSWGGICFGIICFERENKNDYHCCNIFITKEGGNFTLYLIEAQSDKITKTNQLERVIFIFI